MALIDSRHPEQLVDEVPQKEVALYDAFRFDLSNHELIDPEVDRGETTATVEVEPVEVFGHTIPVHEVYVRDPYVFADPVAYSKVRSHVQKMEARIQQDGFNPLTERSEKYPYSIDSGPSGPQVENRYTSAWLAQEELAPLRAWHSLVPSAVALDHLTNPKIGDLISPKGAGAEGVGPLESTPETAAFLRFVDDAVAIRNRAVAMQSIAEEHLRTAVASVVDSESPGVQPNTISWLSLASGTAEPSIRAISNVQETEDFGIDLTVVDYDGRALKKVRGHAAKHGLESTTKTIQTNILDPNLATSLHEEAGKRKFQVVENLGFEEYLPEREEDDDLGGDELGLFRDEDSGLPNASEFTRNAFELVEEGGILISGNMVLDRPQIGFVFGIVDWPLINARSEESIMRVYKRAGILNDPTAKVEMVRVIDEVSGAHVYNIVKVTKKSAQRPLKIPQQALGLS